jgi:hypothetical protein
MGSVENNGFMRDQEGIAAIAIFRRLATLCAPEMAAPLPVHMEALLRRLDETAPCQSEAPQQLVESP